MPLTTTRSLTTVSPSLAGATVVSLDGRRTAGRPSAGATRIVPTVIACDGCPVRDTGQCVDCIVTVMWAEPSLVAGSPGRAGGRA
jgi:hypothetical protein